jgi:hypothetical protein
MVDLTTPLGEDEVMPKNEHYVVPERPKVQPDTAHQKQKKKKKDKKKSSRKDKDASGTPTAAVTGDLLGFDMMGFGGEQAAPPAPTTAPAVIKSSSNPINNAFDDLLGLEMPPSVEAPAAMIQSSEAVEAKARKSAKKASKKKKKKSKL